MRFWLTISAVAALTCTAAAAPLRGVMTSHKASYTDLGATFTCLFSRHSINAAFVNDDYCDCPDGSDEPGTSACSQLLLTGGMGPGFQFQCDSASQGFTVGVLFSHSRVNDGICDCCDGSDEYNAAPGTCKNTCAADAERFAKEAKEREEKRAAGIKAKEDMKREALNRRAQKETELLEAQGQLPDIELKIKEHESVRDTHEETEKAERDKIKQKSLEEKAKWEEEQERLKAEREAAKTEEVPPPPPPPAGALGAICRGWKQTGGCKGTGDREPGGDKDCLAFIESGASGFCDCVIESTNEDALQAFDCGHRLFRCQDICDKGSDDDAAFVDANAKKQEAEAKDPEFKVDDGSSYVHPEADAARNKLAEFTNKKADVERKISDVKGELEKDYGADGIFLSMIGRCYDKEDRQYTYSLCPFNEFKQVSKTGGGTTSMGRWKGWGEQTYSLWGSKQDFSRMIFDNGTGCWGGPARSTEVKVTCGSENALISIEEPSMCTYKAVFQTPAACE